MRRLLFLLAALVAVCGAERTGKPFECCVSTGLCRKSAEQFVLIHSRPVLSHKKLFHDSLCRREEKCVHRGDKLWLIARKLLYIAGYSV